MSEQLKRAAELLRREAQILRESNPYLGELIYSGGRYVSGEFSGNEAAKQDHDELLDAAETVDKAIERLDSQSRTVVEAAERLAEQQARIAELEQNGPEMQRGVDGAGNPWMGTMRQVLEDYKRAAEVEAKLGDEARRTVVTDRQLADAVNELRDIAIKYHSTQQLRERIAGVVRGLVRGESAILRDSANNRGILDGSTVPVSREALEALRSAMSKLRAPMSRTEYAAARACIIEAAYSLLAGVSDGQ